MATEQRTTWGRPLGDCEVCGDSDDTFFTDDGELLCNDCIFERRCDDLVDDTLDEDDR